MRREELESITEAEARAARIRARAARDYDLILAQARREAAQLLEEGKRKARDQAIEALLEEQRRGEAKLAVSKNEVEKSIRNLREQAAGREGRIIEEIIEAYLEAVLGSAKQGDEK